MKCENGSFSVKLNLRLQFRRWISGIIRYGCVTNEGRQDCWSGGVNQSMDKRFCEEAGRRCPLAKIGFLGITMTLFRLTFPNPIFYFFF
ncbi:hypothetical protein MtrunA17_Chr3g0091801 [Medicago truncatula]|uniref:Transmembrane protein, putative n=1 Tax=Medicago truncatula TaxID=3880 RepID=A0A072UUF1_MEDTR|nr:transmembrane protein, putative [Medicago truncatula]RHN66501.1 hypothetical protein MtrunA17_Chr3g0091801 [Medicago truncatula]